MASRQIIADSNAPLRRLILSRITKQSHANGQDRLLPLLFNPNQTDRLLRPIWEMNQCPRTDVAAVVQDRFCLWLRQPEQTRVSARGRQIPKEDDETEDSDEDNDEVDGEFDDIDDFDDGVDDEDGDKHDEK
ncbi:hypothetical protein CK203_031380 [Vitis vinifera]|uniref:Uncharacterized protein n=1 Tax=Vitis vinifera TaxID=29760 RepID=A0A438I8R2_VITVI|nr:hypothetical protein CK203_031380 [Vitis vinifera]